MPLTLPSMMDLDPPISSLLPLLTKAALLPLPNDVTLVLRSVMVEGAALDPVLVERDASA